ncbi:SRPBCC family protein [Ramlibacter rhizophilus]|uniref:SRPBCC family protein n=1 Tax=Ramlibacter rhizophilus TaxID=1781167 RepID=A0A4Z0BM19_9BURK|nr:SRPBCC family protein [Ramlibacter rhizophilus]TFY99850.1 SRPBCC family protein [Ramlibacter rhizophilus]
MARVYVSAVMNASLQEAWAFLRDFGALGNYHPFFCNSFIEDGKPADQVGCVRRFEVREDGGYLREQLLALSDDEHRCRYRILHIDAPWRNYVAEMHLLPVTEGNRCFGEWWATFEVPPEEEAAAVERVAATFRTFFACVDEAQAAGR